MNAIQVVLERLESVRPSGNGSWAARCPAHDDRNPSLSVVQRDGRILLHCHAGCDYTAVLAALNLTTRDLYADNGDGQDRPRIVTAYDYHDAQGNLLYQVVRYHPKAFRQRRPDGRGGWVWSTRGIRKVLYRLPDLLRDPSRTVCVVEGEKDANRLAAEGLLATCSPGGAAKREGRRAEWRAEWRAQYAETLAGRVVIVIPDNDSPGQAHAEDVAASLHGVAASVKMLTLPGLGGKGDASVWLDAGHSVAELERLAAEAPEWEPKPDLAPIGTSVPGQVRKVNAAELAARAPAQIEYLPMLGLEGYIAQGWATLLAGYPKAGKTELMTRLCAEWRGKRILYITEEPESIWSYRLHTLGGDWSHVTLLLGLGMEPAELLGEISEEAASVVVVDTVRNLMQLRDETDNSEVSRVLAPVIAACREARQTLLLLHHVRKGGGQHGEGITGGHAFLGIVDCALELLREQNLGENKRRIRGWGRIHQIEDVIIELAEDGIMEALGDPTALQLEQVKARVLGVLSDDWIKTRELYEELDEPRPGLRTIRDALNALAIAGRVEREPREDKPGATYRYRLFAKPNLEPTPSMVPGQVAVPGSASPSSWPRA